ncbi:MAG: hypothetical protein HY986_19795 [Candidatus Melainabacteria bacterium]|nr:hypothetical protein [Candidatus Melainabacteria bacterium]
MYFPILQSQFLLLNCLGALSIPLTALLASMILSRRESKLRALLAGQLSAFACALFALAVFMLHPQELSFAPIAGLFELKFDLLSLTLALLITFISSIVLFFSERYLVGDSRQTAFMQHLVVLTSFAAFLSASDNLILCLICWHGISLTLWRLVGLRDGSGAARRTVIAHHILSDAAFVLAACLIVAVCGTANLTELADRAALLGEQMLFKAYIPFSALTVSSLLLVISLSIKSALFPFHRWLLATLEAPTPLSGLLHAGVVNVSAVMAARLWPVISGSSQCLVVWGLMAAVSVVAGALVMSTQADVKRKLVFSTVSQMGFMCLQCATGAIPAAIFHLLAHGLFKCHLFLQSGSAVSEGLMKRQWGQPSPADWRRPQTLMVLACVMSMVLPVCYWLLRGSSGESGAVVSCIIAAAAIGCSMPSLQRSGLFLVVLSGLASLLMIEISGTVEHWLKEGLATMALPVGGLLFYSVCAFALVGTLLYAMRDRSFGRAMYVHALNGFYVDEIVGLFAGRRPAAPRRVVAEKR